MRACVVLATLLIGCGSDGSAMEGIYALDTWSRNDGACDAEGPAVNTQSQPVFFLKYEKFFGYGALNMRQCADLAECQAEYGEEDTIHLGGPSFDEGDDDSGWTGQSFFAFGSNGTCSGSVIDYRLDAVGSDGVRIEQRTRDTGDFPANAEGDCDEDDIVEAAEGMPCTELEVFTGTVLER